MDAVGGRRVLLTGATGFIGRHVGALLSAAGAETTAVSVRDPANVHDAVRAAEPELAIHLGGFTDIGASWTDPLACFEANVTGTLHLLDALRDAPCARLVFASTADVYGDVPVPFREDGPVNPLSPYAVSKLAAERLCHLASRTGGPPAVALRLFNAYGPGQPDTRIVADVINSALRGEDVAMTQGLQRRECNYVTDVASTIVMAATAPGLDGEVVNVGSGEAITMRALAETILRLMDDPVKALFGARPERPVEVPVVEASTAKAEALFGTLPRRSLEDGLRETIEWYRNRS